MIDQRTVAEPPLVRERPRPAPSLGTRRRPPVQKIVARWFTRAVVALLALVVVGAVVYVSRAAPIPADTVRAAKGPLRVTVEEDGRTRVRDRYVVAAPVAGTLERVQARAGDVVEQGATIARIAPLVATPLDERTRAATEARLAAAEDTRERARAERARAEGALAFALRDLASSRALAGTGAISETALDRAELDARLRTQELASAEFALRVAEHDVEQTRATLRQPRSKASARDVIEVNSPAPGRVLRVVQESAGPVQPGSPIVEIGDPNALEIVVDVLTSDAVQVKPGARVTLDRWGGEPLAAHVRSVEPSAFTKLSALGVEEQRVRVLVDVDAPPPAWLAVGDGWRVETRIVTWESDSVLRIPTSATFRIGDRWASYVVVDGRARVRTLDLGKRGATDVEIAGGLEPGDEVIVHPSDRIADGARVVRR